MLARQFSCTSNDIKNEIPTREIDRCINSRISRSGISRFVCFRVEAGTRKKKKKKKILDRPLVDGGVGLRIRRSFRFCQLATVPGCWELRFDEDDAVASVVNHRRADGNFYCYPKIPWSARRWNGFKAVRFSAEWYSVETIGKSLSLVAVGDLSVSACFCQRFDPFFLRVSKQVFESSISRTREFLQHPRPRPDNRRFI